MALLFGSVPGLAGTNNSQAAGALFQQFETVFQIKANLLSQSGTHDFRRVPFVPLVRGLAGLGKDVPAEILANADAILLGTKDYTMPKGLGTVHSTFCYVIVLSNSIDIQRYFSQPVSSTVSGRIWSWSANLQEFGENEPRPSTLYVGETGQSYLLVSNNEEELQQLAVRLRDTSDNIFAVLAGLREWEEVGQHKFWGYRRYRHDRVVDKFAAGMTKVTPAMAELIVYADDGTTGILQLYCSTSDDSTSKSAATMMPLLMPRGSGIWQASVPLTDEEKESMKSLIPMTWLFGFGIVV
jgi:hypothetical protein